MPASIYDIICEQGATLVRVVTYKDSAGNPVNLSTYTARMKVRSSRGAPGAQLALTTGGSGIVLQSNGEIEITVPAATTAIIPAGKYRYDLEIMSSSGIVTRVIEGEFTVSGEVTR
jgi:hypothetical protein